MITLEEAKNLQVGDVLLYPAGAKRQYRWRVNGKPKTWKRSLERVQVSLKHGLYDYGYLTEDNLHQFDRA